MRAFRQRYEGGRTRHWYVEIRTPDHRRLRIPTSLVDRAAAEEFGRLAERLAAMAFTRERPVGDLARRVEALPANMREKLAAIGALDAQRVEGTRPLRELLERFEASLKAKGTTTKQAQTVRKRAQRVFDEAGIVFWSDITALAVQDALAKLRDRSPGKPAWSYQSSNHGLAAVRAFTRWAVANGLASEDPTRTLAKLNVSGHRVRERRTLELDEIAKLLKAAADGPVRAGVSGPERRLVYLVAIETGLRRSELASLTVANLTLPKDERGKLKASECAVTLEAKSAKNRTEAALPLRASTAAEIAEHVRDKLPAARVFALPKHWRSAEMFAEDLEAAGILKRDEKTGVLSTFDANGDALDFHSLRHSTSSYLARAGVPVAVHQKLMRHSDPRLSFNVYAHLGKADERVAIDRLPAFAAVKVPAPSAATRELRATGSDGAPTLPAGLPNHCDNVRQPAHANDNGDRVWRTRGDSNTQPSVPKTDALSN